MSRHPTLINIVDERFQQGTAQRGRTVRLTASFTSTVALWAPADCTNILSPLAEGTWMEGWRDSLPKLQARAGLHSLAGSHPSCDGSGLFSLFSVPTQLVSSRGRLIKLAGRRSALLVTSS